MITLSPLHHRHVRDDNPNHHLWNNHGTWFVHFTIHPTHNTKERVRRSLGTKDVVIARKRRDRFFELLSLAERPIDLEREFAA